MSWVAVAAAAATVGGALITSNANNKAVDATSASSAAATAEQKRQFDIAQANQKPWLVTGTSALNKLAGMYGLDTYQPNFSATGGAGVSGTPGVQAAMAYNPQSENGGGALFDVLGGPIGGNMLEGMLGANNRSAIGDIWGALQNGVPPEAISAESWAKAGFGPGGTALGPDGKPVQNIGLQNPVAGNTNQPNAAPGTAPPTTGTPQSPGTYTPGSSQPGVDPYASFYQSPDYAFRLGQGIKGLDASAAAGGSLDSGATRKAAIQYAGNLASGEYNNYANRLAALAGVGQTTATNLGNLGAQYASNVGNIAIGQGNNLASSYLAQGQNYSNTINNLAGIGQGLIINRQGAPNASYNTSTGNWTPGPGGF